MTEETALRRYKRIVMEMSGDDPTFGYCASVPIKRIFKATEEQLADAIGDAVLTFLKKEKEVKPSLGPEARARFLYLHILDSARRSVMSFGPARVSLCAGFGNAWRATHAVEIENAPEPYTDPSVLEEVATADVVSKALAGLKPDLKWTVEMRYGIGHRVHTVREIADHLGLTVQAIHIRLTRAYAEMRKVLFKDGEGVDLCN